MRGEKRADEHRKPPSFQHKDVEVEAQFFVEDRAYLKKLDKKHKELENNTTIFLVSGIRRSRPITVYFDTPNEDLHHNHITLRFRYPFHDSSNPDNCFPPMLSIKSDFDLANFELCSQALSERLEVEEVIHTNLTSFDPQKDLSLQDYPDFKKTIEDVLGDKKIVPLFLTDVRRACADYVVMVEGQGVHLELAIDPCLYYKLSPEQRIQISDEAFQNGCDQAIVSNQEDIKNAEINAAFIQERPQFEVEYKQKYSSRFVTPTQIVCAMNILENRIRDVVGEEFYPKDGKAYEGHQIYDGMKCRPKLPNGKSRQRHRGHDLG